MIETDALPPFKVGGDTPTTVGSAMLNTSEAKEPADLVTVTVYAALLKSENVYAAGVALSVTLGVAVTAMVGVVDGNEATP